MLMDLKGVRKSCVCFWVGGDIHSYPVAFSAVAVKAQNVFVFGDLPLASIILPFCV